MPGRCANPGGVPPVAITANTQIFEKSPKRRRDEAKSETRPRSCFPSVFGRSGLRSADHEYGRSGLRLVGYVFGRSGLRPSLVQGLRPRNAPLQNQVPRVRGWRRVRAGFPGQRAPCRLLAQDACGPPARPFYTWHRACDGGSGAKQSALEAPPSAAAFPRVAKVSAKRPRRSDQSARCQPARYAGRKSPTDPLRAMLPAMRPEGPPYDVTQTPATMSHGCHCSGPTPRIGRTAPARPCYATAAPSCDRSRMPARAHPTTVRLVAGPLAQANCASGPTRRLGRTTPARPCQPTAALRSDDVPAGPLAQLSPAMVLFCE